MTTLKFLAELFGILFETSAKAWRTSRERRLYAKLITQCWLNITDIVQRGAKYGILLNEETGKFSSIYEVMTAEIGVAYIQQEYDYQKERIARIEWLYQNGFTLKGA